MISSKSSRRSNVHQQRHVDQESFNCAILERMQEMEVTIEGQAERIVSLEEEMATQRWKKAYTCGEEEKETVIVTGSGKEESSELEYADEGEGVSSDSSYQSPIVAQEAPLLVFGEVLPGDSQTLLADVQETCGYLVPAIVRIEDNVKMVAAPRENNTPILVWVDEFPMFAVGGQHASHHKPKAYSHSSTHCANHHAMQLGSRPYPQLEYFMDQDPQFPCTRDLCTTVLQAEQGVDQGRVGDAGEPTVNLSDVPRDADGRSLVRSLTYSPTSTCYCPCSPSCGGDCLSSTPYPSGL